MKLILLFIFSVFSLSIASTNILSVFYDSKPENIEVKIKFNYPKEELTKMMLKLNDKSLHDDFTDKILIKKTTKDTLKLNAYYFGDLGPFSNNLAYYETIKADFVIKALSTTKSELIFTNIQIQHRNQRNHAKRVILKKVKKGIKKELKKMNQQSDKK